MMLVLTEYITTFFYKVRKDGTGVGQMVMATDSRCKGTNAPSIRGLVVN